MIIPGVQNPHCRPWCSLNAACIGCSSPPVASPSIVVISAPSASTASIVHDLTQQPGNKRVAADREQRATNQNRGQQKANNHRQDGLACSDQVYGRDYPGYETCAGGYDRDQ